MSYSATVILRQGLNQRAFEELLLNHQLRGKTDRSQGVFGR